MKPINTADPREESRPIRTPLMASGDGRLGAILYVVGGRLSVLLIPSFMIVDYIVGTLVRGGATAVTGSFEKTRFARVIEQRQEKK